MRTFRRSRWLFYVMSLCVLGSAAWFPVTIMAQVLPGSPFQSSGSGGGATYPVSDEVFKVSDDGDPTKIFEFEASGISTGTTRTLTVQNGNYTLAGSNFTNTWAADQVVSSGFRWFFGAGAGTNYNGIAFNTAQTPDGAFLGTGAIANSWVLGEISDYGSDFNNGHCAGVACISPTLHAVPNAVSTTQSSGFAYYGTAGRAVRALTESSATSVVQIPVAAGTGVGGTITFTAFAADATDQQTLTGVLQYAAVNKAGTETCATPTLTGTALNSVSVGTLTCTYACSTAAANAVDIQFNCVSSLTQTTLNLYWRLNALGATEPLPQ